MTRRWPSWTIRLAGLTSRWASPARHIRSIASNPGLRDTYGLTWADFQPQRSLLVTADALLSGEIDVGLMFSTSAELNTPWLFVLEDGRGLQPPENVVPIVRADALDRWRLAGSDPLAKLAARLTTEDLRAMNERVGDDEPIESVARSWLASVGLLAG